MKLFRILTHNGRRWTLYADSFISREQALNSVQRNHLIEWRGQYRVKIEEYDDDRHSEYDDDTPTLSS